MENTETINGVQVTALNFDNWTAYDDWLIENGQVYSVFDLEEKDSKIFIKYCLKEDYKKLGL